MGKQVNNLIIQGLVVDVLPPTETPKGYQYQQIAIKQMEHKYPNIIAVSVWDWQVNTFSIGDEVRASITIEAKKSDKGSYYSNKVSAWFIQKINS